MTWPDGPWLPIFYHRSTPLDLSCSRWTCLTSQTAVPAASDTSWLLSNILWASRQRPGPVGVSAYDQDQRQNGSDCSCSRGTVDAWGAGRPTVGAAAKDRVACRIVLGVRSQPSPSRLRHRLSKKKFRWRLLGFDQCGAIGLALSVRWLIVQCAGVTVSETIRCTAQPCEAGRYCYCYPCWMQYQSAAGLLVCAVQCVHIACAVSYVYNTVLVAVKAARWMARTRAGTCLS